MEFMAGKPDNYYQLACVDPPYGLGVDKMRLFDGAKAQKRHKEYRDIRPTAAYFTELFRISENQVIWGGNYFDLPPTRCNIIWDKMQKFSSADFELAWTSFNSPSRAFRMARAVAYGKGTIHPTQKPVALYDWIYRNYAKEGMRVFDSHLGSGSSAISAHYNGLIFDGTEIDEDYYNAAKIRFKAETSQMVLV